LEVLFTEKKLHENYRLASSLTFACTSTQFHISTFKSVGINDPEGEENVTTPKMYE
jgi:hypothetical protein